MRNAVACAVLPLVVTLAAGCASRATTGSDAVTPPLVTSGPTVIAVTSSPTVGPGTMFSPPPPPPASPAPTFDAGHTLTNADSGAVVEMKVGQRVAIALTPEGAFGNWDVPVIDGGALKLAYHTGGYPGTAPLTATFVAVTAGTATLRTGTDLGCFHTKPPCLPPVQIWTATVKVTS